jgi:hypothetical protein
MKLPRIAVALSLGVTMALSGAYAFAQSLPSAQQPQAQQPAITFAPATAQGAITRFVLGPMGRVHGIVLDSGQLVTLGRDGDRAAQSLGVGARIRAQGYASPQAPTTILAATVYDSSGNVLVQPNPRMVQRLTQPGGMRGMRGMRGMHGRHGMRGQGQPGAQGQPGMHRGGHGGRFAMMQQQLASLPVRSASGTVQTLLVGPRGHIRGAVLQDGTSVHLPPSLSQAAAQQRLAVGQSLTVQGRGNQYARGVSVMAERLTFANGATAIASAPVFNHGPGMRGHGMRGMRGQGPFGPQGAQGPAVNAPQK